MDTEQSPAFGMLLCRFRGRGWPLARGADRARRAEPPGHQHPRTRLPAVSPPRYRPFAGPGAHPLRGRQRRSRGGRAPTKSTLVLWVLYLAGHVSDRAALPRASAPPAKQANGRSERMQPPGPCHGPPRRSPGRHSLFLVDNAVAQDDALVADIDTARPRDDALHFLVALATE